MLDKNKYKKQTNMKYIKRHQNRADAYEFYKSIQKEKKKYVVGCNAEVAINEYRDGIMYKSNTDSAVKIAHPGKLIPAYKSNTYNKMPFSDDEKIGIIECDGCITGIGDQTFFKQPSIIEVWVPGTCNSFGTAAFYFADIEKIHIENGLKGFSPHCFAGSKLQEIVLPASTTAVMAQAFSQCPNLSKVTINEGILHLDNFVFAMSPNLSEVVFPQALTRYSYNSAEITLAEVEDKQDFRGSTLLDYPDQSINYGAFQGTGVREMNFPDGLKIIWTQTCKDCTELSSVTFGNDTLQIGLYAFEGCVNLENVTFNDGLYSIQQRAFKDCAIKHINIPDSVNIIWNYAFTGCPVETFEIGSGIKYLAYGAFRDMSQLTTITVHAVEPPHLSSDSFNNNTSLTEIRVPAGSVDAYKAAYTWSNMADKIVPITE